MASVLEPERLAGGPCPFGGPPGRSPPTGVTLRLHAPWCNRKKREEVAFDTEVGPAGGGRAYAPHGNRDVSPKM